MRTRVKICGITRIQDALKVAESGGDAIGLVFYPGSPRHVNIEQAQSIVKALPAFVSVVGLFVDASQSTIDEVISKVAIDCLQFHGNETAKMCRLFNKPYIKAIRMQSHTDLFALSQNYHDASAILLDAYDSKSKGGTGKRFNWDLIPDTLSQPIILAGGLHAGNAEQAIRTVAPYALDVSSGVESEKGIKDHNKIATFIEKTNIQTTI